jgi:histidinol dehydrogenase
MMISTFDVSKQDEIAPTVARIRRSTAVPAEVEAEVRRVIDTVREGGDDALVELTLRFDGEVLDPDRLEVPSTEGEAALDALDSPTREALGKAAERIAEFARESLASDWRREAAPGLTVGQVHRPLDTAGIYVPGGRFPYPSTVLMTGVLAREAGVGEIVFCVPPSDGGSPNATTLAATAMVGGCRVFSVGGAQAVAAMAFGTRSIPRCRIIAGPGNVYVATAKRILAGVVSTDLEAGPSEVAAYVDDSVDLSYPVADMLAQLEHDPLSLAVIVSERSDILEAAAGVTSGLLEGLEEGPVGAADINLVRCATRELSLGFLNELAPEHLELMADSSEELLSGVTSAGCVFLGPMSAVALGDYISGPSHVLPTGGTAARLSGLRCEDFRRTMNVISYTEEGFEADAPQAGVLAGLEGLRFHALSLDIRNRRGRR